MSLFQKAQQAVDAAANAPATVSLPVMLGSLVLSILQPVAVIITIVWGCLQIHGVVEKRWGRDFLWLNRVLRRKVK